MSRRNLVDITGRVEELTLYLAMFREAEPIMAAAFRLADGIHEDERTEWMSDKIAQLVACCESCLEFQDANSLMRAEHLATEIVEASKRGELHTSTVN